MNVYAIQNIEAGVIDFDTADGYDCYVREETPQE